MQNPYDRSSDLVLRAVVPASSLSTSSALSLATTTTAGGGVAGSDPALNATSTVNQTTTGSSSSSSKLEHLLKSGKLVASDVLGKLFPPQEGLSEEELLALPGGMTALSSGIPGPFVVVASEGNCDPMSVIHLQESIETQLKQNEARDVGVCSIREGIYANALNELIRQVTVGCPERGLLLSELRDEMNETNATFDALFGNSCEYSVRKSIERDQKKHMQSKVHAMVSEVRGLENRVHELRAKYDGIDKRFNEQRQAEEKVHIEEVAFLKKGNLQLTNEIKRLSQ